VYGSQILVTEFTRADLSDHFTLRAIDRVRVKGKSAPTQVYEVLGERNYEPSDAHRWFADGLEAYGRLAFAKALDLFRKGCNGDPLCEVFVSRCEQLLVKPPPGDWDGVWHLESK
jgi:adenylate cyclase